MKTALIISTLIIIFLGWLVFDLKTNNDITYHDLEASKKFNTEQANSFHDYVKASRDTIETQRLIIANKNEETERAKEFARKAQGRSNTSRVQVARVQPIIDSLAKKDTVIQILNVAYHNCDTTVQAQDAVIKAQGEELIATGQGLKTAISAFKASQEESISLRSALADTEKISELKQKKAKRKGFRKGLGLGIAIAIGVLLL